MPKPNDPCTCGSGKKYKKCCFHEQSKKKSAACGGGGSSGFITTGAANNPLEGHDLKELLNYCNNEQELDSLMKSMKQQPHHFQIKLQHLAARKCVVTDFLPLMSKVLQISPNDITCQVKDLKNDEIVELFKSYVINCCESLYMAEQDDEHMKLLRKNTPRGMVEHERCFAFEKRYLETYLQAMDKHLSSKNDDSGGSCSSSRPAVDLAAGAGAFTFEYAKHFDGMSTTNMNLTWYPTEWENPTGQRNPFTFLRESLHWMVTDIIDSTSPSSYVPATFGLERTLQAGVSETETFINAIPTREFLFVDANGRAVYAGDKVTLVGLSKVEYNGKHGFLQGKDVKTEGRFAVMLPSLTLNINRKAMSFKSTNLLVLVNDDESEKYYHQELLDGLMKHARVLDLQNKSTWRDNISELFGRCAVVTCTSLLTQVGHRAPDIWENVFDCACTLLAPGGILLLHDTIKFGKFGNTRCMQSYGEFLGLELEEFSEPIKDDDGEDHWGRMILMVWRKK